MVLTISLLFFILSYKVLSGLSSSSGAGITGATFLAVAVALILPFILNWYKKSNAKKNLRRNIYHYLQKIQGNEGTGLRKGILFVSLDEIGFFEKLFWQADLLCDVQIEAIRTSLSFMKNGGSKRENAVGSLFGYDFAGKNYEKIKKIINETLLHFVPGKKTKKNNTPG